MRTYHIHPLLAVFYTSSAIAVAALFLVFGATAFAASLSQPTTGDATIFRLLYDRGGLVARAATVPKEPELPTVFGITVANNGLTYIKNANVVEVSGSTMTIEVSWGTTSFPWVVETSFVTNFERRDNTKSKLSSIVVGEYITVTGMLDTTTSQPTILARSVRVF